MARRVLELKTEPLLLAGEKDAPAPGYQTASLRGLESGRAAGVVSASNKSSLLKLLAGQYPLAGGDVYVNGRSLTSFQ